MAGPAPSLENAGRRVVRFAFGVTLAVVLSQLMAWPLAQICPVLVVLLMQDAGAQPLRTALRIIVTAVLAMAGGFLLAFTLLPYPAIVVMVACILLFRMYLYLLVSGMHLTALVGVILGTVVVPALVQLLPELALIFVYGFTINFIVAFLCSWIAFTLITVRETVPTHESEPLSYAQARPIAADLTLVVAPLLVGFLVFGWTNILTLIYAVLFSTGLSSSGGGQLGMKSLTANLLIAGIGMVLMYELLVILPGVAALVGLVFVVSLICGRQIFSGRSSAQIWSSGYVGLLILLGTSLLSEDVATGTKVADRLMQILLATTYIVLAYRVIDLIRGLATRGPGSLFHRSTGSAP